MLTFVQVRHPVFFQPLRRGNGRLQEILVPRGVHFSVNQHASGIRIIRRNFCVALFPDLATQTHRRLYFPTVSTLNEKNIKGNMFKKVIHKYDN